MRNYFQALNLLEEKLKKKERFSKEMILEVQAIIEKGASKEKMELRDPSRRAYYLQYMILKPVHQNI